MVTNLAGLCSVLLTTAALWNAIVCPLASSFDRHIRGTTGVPTIFSEDMIHLA